MIAVNRPTSIPYPTLLAGSRRRFLLREAGMKRRRGLSQPQYRLRVGEVRVFPAEMQDAATARCAVV